MLGRAGQRPPRRPSLTPALRLPTPAQQTLEMVADGDIVMYADAGCSFKGDPARYFAAARDLGYVFFRNGHIKEGRGVYFTNEGWTKGDAFVKMGMPMETWGKQPQIIATVVLFRKSAFVMSFVREWLESCRDPQLLTDSPSVAPNAPSFKVPSRSAAPPPLQLRAWSLQSQQHLRTLSHRSTGTTSRCSAC